MPEIQRAAGMCRVTQRIATKQSKSAWGIALLMSIRRFIQANIADTMDLSFSNPAAGTRINHKRQCQRAPPDGVTNGA
jgi:hypothetical protein